MLVFISGFAVALIAAFIVARFMSSKGIKRDYSCNVKGEG